MLNDNIIAKIDSYCYFIDKGKPVAMEPVKSEDIKEVADIIEKNKKSCFYRDLTRAEWEAFGYSEGIDSNYIQVWIYEKPIMLDVIKMMPKRPETIYDHWVLGKIFGFSDEKIEEYILEIFP